APRRAPERAKETSMSKATTAALALALGAGAGAAIYHFTRDDKKKPGDPPPASGENTAPAKALTGAAPTMSTTVAAPPRKPGACSLKLDKAGLTLEGEKVDIKLAVARCKVAGKAELAVAPDAPLAVHRELYGALLAAGVPTVVKAP
ncbi:MAG: hypothetical protein K8M05_39670, partial [Deltaproteobacteria bacterium]|nr:hypothetical protein [Kofleriaceae bacterium]